MPTFVLRVERLPTRDDWDRALTGAVAGATRPGRLGGVPQARREEFLGPSAGATSTRTRRCCRPSRGCTARPTPSPTASRSPGRRCSSSTGRRHRADHRADRVPVGDDDDVESLHERIKVAERAMLVDTVGRIAREGFTINDRKVGSAHEHHFRDCDRRRPIRRALISVYDKSGLEDLARALADAGVELVSTGSTAPGDRGPGVPVTKVEDLTGFPECLDGRVKTLHPRSTPGSSPTAGCDPTSSSSLISASSRSTWWCPTSTRSPPPCVRRDSGRVRRADRHRRSVDGASRGEEPSRAS